MNNTNLFKKIQTDKNGAKKIIPQGEEEADKHADKFHNANSMETYTYNENELWQLAYKHFKAGWQAKQAVLNQHESLIISLVRCVLASDPNNAISHQIMRLYKFYIQTDNLAMANRLHELLNTPDDPNNNFKLVQSTEQAEHTGLKELIDIRNKLYNDLPTGDLGGVNAWNLLQTIKWHINDLDVFMSRWQATVVPVENGLKWVKASERLPEKAGEENSVIIRGEAFGKDPFGHHHNSPFVTTGFKNFDQDNPRLYFLIGNESFLTNENIEWLDEQPVPATPEK